MKFFVRLRRSRGSSSHGGSSGRGGGVRTKEDIKPYFIRTSVHYGYQCRAICSYAERRSWHDRRADERAAASARDRNDRVVVPLLSRVDPRRLSNRETYAYNRITSKTRVRHAYSVILLNCMMRCVVYLRCDRSAIASLKSLIFGLVT